eukprot:7608514-Alexandrium_andersonii.AAC.1
MRSAQLCPVTHESTDSRRPDRVLPDGAAVPVAALAALDLDVHACAPVGACLWPRLDDEVAVLDDRPAGLLRAVGRGRACTFDRAARQLVGVTGVSRAIH